MHLDDDRAMPRSSESPAGTPPRSPPASRVPDDHPARSAEERLLHELQDECSDVGVSARGMNVAGFEAGVRDFAREARRYGATIEQTIILLKECLRDERLRQEDRDQYDRLRERAVRWVIETYYDTTP